MNNNWRYALFTLGIIPVLILTAQSVTATPFLIITIIAAIIVAIVTFQKPENGLIIIVFSMLLSPQIVVASNPGHDVTVRVDDLLIVVMLLAWLAYTAKEKDWKGFIKTPIDSNLILISVVYITSTGLGVIAGYLNPIKSMFYMLKYLEYFVLFWLTANIVSSSKSLPKFLIAGTVTAIIVTIYAYSLFGKAARVYAPFESTVGGGEPASLAGYYLVVYAIVLSFFLNSSDKRVRYFCLGLALFMLPPFIKTLSRASYLAFIPLVGTLLIFTRKRKSQFALMLIAGVIFFPIVLPDLYSSMVNRVSATFIGDSGMSRGESLADKKIRDPSATDRIDSWKWVVNDRLTADFKSLVIGRGVTGVGFVDGQLFTFLGEIGILGTAAFYWMLFKVILIGYRNYKSLEGEIPKSLSLGLVSGLIALLTQSATTNTFVIVRINEPMWFSIALVLVLPDLAAQGNAIAAGAAA